MTKRIIDEVKVRHKNHEDYHSLKVKCTHGFYRGAVYRGDVQLRVDPDDLKGLRAAGVKLRYFDYGSRVEFIWLRAVDAATLPAVRLFVLSRSPHAYRYGRFAGDVAIPEEEDVDYPLGPFTPRTVGADGVGGDDYRPPPAPSGLIGMLTLALAAVAGRRAVTLNLAVRAFTWRYTLTQTETARLPERAQLTGEWSVAAESEGLPANIIFRCTEEEGRLHFVSSVPIPTRRPVGRYIRLRRDGRKINLPVPDVRDTAHCNPDPDTSTITQKIKRLRFQG